MLDSVPRCELGHIRLRLPPPPPHTFPTCLDFVSPIPFPSPSPPTHTGCPASIEVGGLSVEATLAGRTQVWLSET